MKKALNISLWILLFAGFFTLLSFSTHKHQARTCQDLVLKIQNANEFPLINEATIEQILADNNFRIRGQNIQDIPIDQIETKITSLSHVKSSKVFSNIEGDLEVSLIQKTPIARVFNQNGDSFYLDEYGKRMNLSSLYSARLLSITSDQVLSFNSNGENQENIEIENLVDLIQFVNNDSFWKSQIVRIHIDKNKEIELTPRIGNHKILIGKASDLRTKFEKLWAFYQSCSESGSWTAYKTLNLKYKDQIVCTKK